MDRIPAIFGIELESRNIGFLVILSPPHPLRQTQKGFINLPELLE
jgi:hypothetical protein